MKRFVLLFVLCLISTSCAWTYRLNSSVGQRYMVKDIGSVIFYDEPSLKSPSFSLQKQEMFTVIGLVCPEGKFSCNMQVLKDPYAPFFKIRFDSGKEGYINSKDFYILEKSQPRPALPPPPAPKDSMICDPIPYKKGSFRCRME